MLSWIEKTITYLWHWWKFKIPKSGTLVNLNLKLSGCQQKWIVSSLNGYLCLDYLKTSQRCYYNLPNSAFWGWLSMESLPQNPGFRINPDMFHPWLCLGFTVAPFSMFEEWLYAYMISIKISWAVSYGCEYSWRCFQWIFTTIISPSKKEKMSHLENKIKTSQLGLTHGWKFKISKILLSKKFVKRGPDLKGFFSSFFNLFSFKLRRRSKLQNLKK